MVVIGLSSLLMLGEFLVSSTVKIIGAVTGKGKKKRNSERKSTPPPHPGFKDIEQIRRQERESIAASKAAASKAATDPPTYDKNHTEQHEPPGGVMHTKAGVSRSYSKRLLHIMRNRQPGKKG